jgi:hypothetical protein
MSVCSAPGKEAVSIGGLFNIRSGICDLSRAGD